MRVLIAHSSTEISGVVTFITTAGAALQAAGHNVTFYFTEKEDAPNRETLISIQHTGAQVYINERPQGDFDVILINSRRAHAATKDIGGFRNFIVHGLMEENLLPPECGMDMITCLSVASFDYINVPGVQKRLTPNIIDIEKYRMRTPPGKELRKVLLVDARNGLFYFNKWISACSRLGIFFGIAGKTMYSDVPRVDLVADYNEADLVVGYGRVVYEAMACGRPVIIYGVNGGDGYVTTDNFFECQKHNCSGWALRTMQAPAEITVDAIITELRKYRAIHGEANRAMVEDSVAAALNVQKLLPSFLAI